ASTYIQLSLRDALPILQRVMARQAEAERERRAKVIAAEGEFQAARKLADAAEVLATQPGTLQLRYLQTIVEISSGNNSVTLFPLPLELLRALEAIGGGAPPRAEGPPPAGPPAAGGVGGPRGTPPGRESAATG